MACLNRGIFLCLFRFYCFDIQLFIFLLQSIQFLLLLYLAAKFLLGGHQRHIQHDRQPTQNLISLDPISPVLAVKPERRLPS